MERLEEALAKLASNVTKKLDDFLLRVASLETNTHHSPSLSSSSAIPTPNPPPVGEPNPLHAPETWVEVLALHGESRGQDPIQSSSKEKEGAILRFYW